MSLIYDYLKIHGESGSDKDSDVEIPPTLKRRDTTRLDKQSLLLILGSCLIGVLFIFLIFKIIAPDQGVQMAPVSPVKQIPAASPSQSPPETKPVLQQGKTAPAIALLPPDSARENAAGEPVQVFPETASPVMADAAESPQASGSFAGEPGPLRKKMIQPLELQSHARKITFPENAPLYSEPETPAEKAATARTPSMQRSSYSRPQPVDQGKSKKYYQAGLQSQRRGDQRLAEIYYKKALEEMGHHLNAMINLSALYVQQQRYAEAQDILAEILTLDPGNSKALVNMGVVSLYDDKETQAKKYFQAALDANPTEENALVNLAYLAEKRRDFVETEKYYRQLLQIAPENIEVLLSYGHLLEEAERYAEAMALYTDILGLGSVKGNPQLHNKITQRLRLLTGAVRN